MKNLRVILLKKSTVMGLQNLEQPPLQPDPENCWIAQGRFDAIWSCKPPVEQGNVFWRMHKCNEAIVKKNTTECYYHPVYLLSNEDDSDFWEDIRCFLAIVRIHFSESVPGGNVHEILSEKLRSEFGEKNYRFQSYWTAELSDMVLGVQSDSIKDLLDKILSLRTYSEIGRVYTYLGVCNKFLKSRDVQFKQDDQIPLCSMRFAVHAPEKAHTAINFIKEILGDTTTCAVIGVDDIIMNWTQLPVEKLIALYRFWYRTATQEQRNVFSAFSSITTRMGVTLNWGENLKPSKRTEELQKACDKLVRLLCETRDTILEVTGEPDHLGVYGENSWLFPLCELTTALSRLSQTSVLDEFVYLMLSAVMTFLCHIRVRLQAVDEFKALKREDCTFFVDSWNYLMEHIMRTEGQLTQFPQMRPVLYDIPLTILEYMLSFLEKCAKILRCELEMPINFLIVPKQCAEIEAQEMFRPREGDSIPGLVLISIPLHKMYRTGETQLVLCHEVSHFVGKKYRQREERIHYYAESVGNLMDDAIFQTHSEAFRKACVEWLGEELSKAKLVYMKDIERRLKEELERIFALDKFNSMQSYLSDLIYNLLCKVNTEPNASPFTLPSDSVVLWMAYEDALIRLENVGYLYKETIADVFMMLLLDLSPEHYIQLVLSDLWSNGKCQYELAADRIYICLTAIEKEIPRCSAMIVFPDRDSEDLRRVDKVLTVLLKKSAIFGGKFAKDDDIRCNISSACIEPILAYASECAQLLRRDLGKERSEDAQELRAMFRNMCSSDVSYSMLQENIAIYRTCILNAQNNMQVDYSMGRS